MPLCVALAVTMAVALNAAAEPRSLNDVQVFARVGFPGQPEAIAVGPDGLVYVGTNQENRGSGPGPDRGFSSTTSMVGLSERR